MGRSNTLRIGIVASFAIAVSLTGCGSIEAGDDAASTEIGSVQAEGAETGDDPEADAPGSLAAVDQQDDPDFVAESGALPPLGAIEEALDEFTACLNGEGANVAPTSLQQMTAKLADLPPGADRAATFAHFYDRDLDDPTVAAAIVACEHILDDPAISIFVPAS